MSRAAKGTLPRTCYLHLLDVYEHAVEGIGTAYQDIEDARRAEDTELADFFISVWRENVQRAVEARRLLLQWGEGVEDVSTPSIDALNPQPMVPNPPLVHTPSPKGGH